MKPVLCPRGSVHTIMKERNMDETIIREHRSEDTPSLLEIAVAAWESIFSCYRETMGEDLFGAVFPDWQEDKKRQVEEACGGQRGSMVYVAERNGEVVGFVTFYPNPVPGVYEMGNNAVRPDFQGRGIGQMMYERVFEKLRELGVHSVKVLTGGDPSHAPARRAYEKAGFKVQLPMVDYYRRL